MVLVLNYYSINHPLISVHEWILKDEKESENESCDKMARINQQVLVNVQLIHIVVVDVSLVLFSKH
jgi:hypothetical protein